MSVDKTPSIVEIFDDNTMSDKERTDNIIQEETKTETKTGTKTESDEPILKYADIVKIPRNYKLLKESYLIFGRKYYECPFKLVNDNIKLFDKDLVEIPFDIRVLIVKPFSIKIDTLYNENNQGILVGEINKTLLEICPKYEHYINYSDKPKNTFITCESSKEPMFMTSTEINIVIIEKKKNMTVSEKLIY